MATEKDQVDVMEAETIVDKVPVVKGGAKVDHLDGLTA